MDTDRLFAFVCSAHPAQSTPARIASRNTARCASPLIFSGGKRGRSARGSRDSAGRFPSSVSHTASNESQAHEFSDDIITTVGVKRSRDAEMSSSHIFRQLSCVEEYIGLAPAVNYTVPAPVPTAQYAAPTLTKTTAT